MKLVTLARLIALGGALVAAPAFADQALANAKNCMSCHTVERKLVGPSYKEVATKYAAQKDAGNGPPAFVADDGEDVRLSDARRCQERTPIEAQPIEIRPAIHRR